MHHIISHSIFQSSNDLPTFNHSFVAAATISELQSLINSSGGSTGHNCAEGSIACDTDWRSPLATGIEWDVSPCEDNRHSELRLFRDEISMQILKKISESDWF